VPIADASPTVAIVVAAAAILSASASIAAAVVVWNLGVKRFAHERAESDRKDARYVLAAGALALGQAKTTLREAYGRFEAPLGNLAREWPDNTWDTLNDILDAAEALEAALAALRIRFDKSDPVVGELGLALGDVRALAALYRRAAGSVFGASQNRDELADSERGEKLNVSYDGHKDAFLDAAQRLAGAKL
jgi:hypothetical protein